MSSRSRAAQALAGHLSRATATAVTVSWHNPTRRPGHGAWRVEWADGPTVAALRRLAAAHARHLAPLDLGTLRWSRRYTPPPSPATTPAPTRWRPPSSPRP
jgi:hypothetical protein